MRLAVSNIAWNVSEDEEVAQLLGNYAINAIDIAPGKYFPDPVNTNNSDIAWVRAWWAAHGIEITGMQALLFGTTGLNVFGSLETQEAMQIHLAAVCRIAEGLGATRLVFGSPKNRDRSGLTDQQTVEIAVPFFRSLGDIAQSHGVIFCLEPNPICYGSNFMTNTSQTAHIVKQVNHPCIKMQLDTGALTVNNEDAWTILAQYASLVGHIHASEPDLHPLGDGSTNHEKICVALEHYLPDHLVCIEMLTTKNEPSLSSIERALKTATYNYHAFLGASQ